MSLQNTIVNNSFNKIFILTKKCIGMESPCLPVNDAQNSNHLNHIANAPPLHIKIYKYKLNARHYFDQSTQNECVHTTVNGIVMANTN